MFHEREKMQKIVIFTIKHFFIDFGCIYSQNKIRYHRINKQEYLQMVVFSLFSSFFASIIQNIMLPLALYTELALLILFSLHKTKTLTSNISFIICLQFLSFGINYAFSSFSFLLVASLFYSLTQKYKDFFSLHIIIYSFSGMLQLAFLFILFQKSRFKKGIVDLENHFSDNISILISISIFFLINLFLGKDFSILLFFVIFLLVIIFGAIIPLCWRKYLSNNYIRRAQNQTIAILEKKIEEQKNEIEDLSKIIHKDNKLVSALYLSVQKLCSNPDKEQAERLKQELEPLAQERKGMLQRYEAEEALLQKTKVFSTDVILSYLFQRASEQNINFSVTVTGDIRYMTEHIIDENLLNTILADLGENAVIATKKSDTRNILLSLGVRDGYYYVDVFDSGLRFEPEVIKHLGKARYTTHKEEGGSGIGLMTTFEILRKQNGSFEIEEFTDNSMFTKRVSVLFDGQGNKLISCLSEPRHVND